MVVFRGLSDSQTLANTDDGSGTDAVQAANGRYGCAITTGNVTQGIAASYGVIFGSSQFLQLFLMIERIAFGNDIFVGLDLVVVKINQQLGVEGVAQETDFKVQV